MANQIEDIKSALACPGGASSDFDLNPDVALPAGRVLRPAAVLIPLIERTSGLNVILTKRSSRLKHHPGQIAFPGGKVESFDKDATDAALREAFEEIALPPEIVTPLGALATHETVTGFSVTPVIGLLSRDFETVPEAGEVAEVFEVPFDFVVDQSRYSIQHRIWQGTKRYYHTVPCGPYYIWGATARILYALADRLER